MLPHYTEANPAGLFTTARVSLRHLVFLWRWSERDPARERQQKAPVLTTEPFHKPSEKVYQPPALARTYVRRQGELHQQAQLPPSTITSNNQRVWNQPAPGPVATPTSQLSPAWWGQLLGARQVGTPRFTKIQLALG